MASTIEIIANIALALSVVIALIFGIAEVKATQRDRHERLTFETLRTFNTREFAELIYFVRIVKMPSTQQEFNDLPSDQQIMLIQGSQQMESLGMLVYERYLDLDLVDKTIGSFVSTTWTRYKPMFEDMRKNIPNPYLGEYFQWLVERIDRQMREHPRQPFHAQNRSSHSKQMIFDERAGQ